MRTFTFFVFTFSLFLFSCKEKEPDKPDFLLDEEQMVDVMVDMQLVETAQNLKVIDHDTAQTGYLQDFNAIFETYGTTKADFDSSLFYYSTKTERMNVIYDKILEELYELESEVKNDQ